jgi:hypothetical protein
MDLVDKLDRIRTGQTPSGVYRLISRPAPDDLIATVAAWGWRGFHLDGRTIVDKPSFLAAAAAAMAFPAYFGRNWDAFEEMIRDLSWAPAAGYVLLYTGVRRFAAARPAEWRVALDIFRHAVRAWEAHNVPMVVLLADNWFWRAPLPSLDIVDPVGPSA